MTEADLMRLIVRELSVGNVRLFRNNVGKLKDSRDRYVTYGLGVGSSDLIGIKHQCSRDVAIVVGQFIAIEVKRPGQKATPEQQNFIDTIRKLGGLAGVAHSVEEARAILDGA
jgi:hypothetical protein